MGFKDRAEHAVSEQADKQVKARAAREDAASTHDVDTVHTPSAPDAHDASFPSASSDDVPSPASRQKRRVNMTLSEDVHDAMKAVAEEYGTSVSALCLEGWLAVKGRYGR